MLRSYIDLTTGHSVPNPRLSSLPTRNPRLSLPPRGLGTRVGDLLQITLDALLLLGIDAQNFPEGRFRLVELLQAQMRSSAMNVRLQAIPADGDGGGAVDQRLVEPLQLDQSLSIGKEGCLQLYTVESRNNGLAYNRSHSQVP